MLAEERRRREKLRFPQLKRDGGNVYNWTISLGNHYHLPNSKSQKQEKKNKKKIEPLTIFPEPAPIHPSLPSPTQIKKRKEERRRRRKKRLV